ncbi:MAG: DUF2284 domain-containing protein [Clostridia bacterium]
MFIEENKRTLTQEMAKEAGFDHFGYTTIENLEFLPDVRGMCADNRCGKYGTNWACPPACGTLEEIAERVKAYDYAMILQSTEQMEDDYDWDAIQKAGKRCGESLRKLNKQLQNLGVKTLPMGAGGCSKCEKCTYPDAPCRFPDDLIHSMEAYGLFVTGECRKAGMKYTYGPQTMTINATILVKEN